MAISNNHFRARMVISFFVFFLYKNAPFWVWLISTRRSHTARLLNPWSMSTKKKDGKGGEVSSRAVFEHKNKNRANSAIFKVRDFACFCGSKYVPSTLAVGAAKLLVGFVEWTRHTVQLCAPKRRGQPGKCAIYITNPRRGGARNHV